jgi:hypothetical protein
VQAKSCFSTLGEIPRTIGEPAHVLLHGRASDMIFLDTVLNFVPDEADTKDLINILKRNGLTTSMMLASESPYRECPCCKNDCSWELKRALRCIESSSTTTRFWYPESDDRNDFKSVVRTCTVRLDRSQANCFPSTSPSNPVVPTRTHSVEHRPHQLSFRSYPATKNG